MLSHSPHSWWYMYMMLYENETESPPVVKIQYSNNTTGARGLSAECNWALCIYTLFEWMYKWTCMWNVHKEKWIVNLNMCMFVCVSSEWNGKRGCWGMAMTCVYDVVMSPWNIFSWKMSIKEMHNKCILKWKMSVIYWER